MLLPTIFLLFVVVVKCLFLLSQPLGMEFLHLLPVSIRYIHRHLQLCGSIFHYLVNMLIDGVDLVADSIHGSTYGAIGVSDICLANAVILSYCMCSAAKIRINSEYSKYNEKYYSFARVYMIGKAENIPHSPHFPHPRWV